MVAKTQASIQGLRRANQATARLLHELSRMARPGMTTRELDDYAMSYITQLGAIPVFHTEEGFPGCINTSINDAAVHGEDEAQLEGVLHQALHAPTQRHAQQRAGCPTAQAQQGRLQPE